MTGEPVLIFFSDKLWTLQLAGPCRLPYCCLLCFSSSVRILHVFDKLPQVRQCDDMFSKILNQIKNQPSGWTAELIGMARGAENSPPKVLIADVLEVD